MDEDDAEEMKFEEVCEQNKIADFNMQEHENKAIWFGRKKKSDVGTRRGPKSRRKAVDEASIDCVKQKLFDIEAKYHDCI